MKTSFYMRLAVNNIRKNSGTYFPYMLTCIMTVMVFYLVKSLSLNPGLTKMVGEDTVAYMMELGARVIELFAVIFLFYTNSFLIKRRKKEFGLFNILGMEKKHLAKVLFLETLITAVISLGLGFVFGIALDKMMFLLILKMLDAEISLGFFISAEAIRTTAILFCIIFLLIYLKSVFTVGLSNPIELLRGSRAGEKEPKAKWALALIGAVMLCIAYDMALTIKNPIASIPVFFVAVILVVVATYLLFTAGSIAVLKLMRKNKTFYYKAKHFISVSGMIYRMKQNAVGLANICILSTMVLVTVSSTTSLMVGMEEIMRTRYPNDFGIYSSETDDARNKELFKEIDNICYEMNVPVTEKIQYSYMTFSVIQMGDSFETDDALINTWEAMDAIRVLLFLPLSDYNRITGINRELQDHEMLMYASRERYEEPVMHLFGEEWRVAEQVKQFIGNGVSESVIASTYYCIVRDEEYETLMKTAEEELERPYSPDLYYGFDTTAEKAVQLELYERIFNTLRGFEFNGYVECRQAEKGSILALYGGFFFLGIFLGFLFMMAAVLIIYYKQISEGYEDRERFIIMQKVGMTKAEVKKTIRSQVLTVFFLPLIAAGIHMAAAFPMITLLLALLNMVDVKLYLICTVICFLVFVLLYVLIYSLTARTYYKIVSR